MVLFVVAANTAEIGIYALMNKKVRVHLISAFHWFQQPFIQAVSGLG